MRHVKVMLPSKMSHTQEDGQKMLLTSTKTEISDRQKAYLKVKSLITSQKELQAEWGKKKSTENAELVHVRPLNQLNISQIIEMQLQQNTEQET